ncbi:MAG TPA: hypothetical protein VM686_30735, partial [Polyangiaceae bacterium]|nr:hypothetical protein [Polyangiaceae bacterium]
AWSVFSPEPAELFGEPVKQLDFGIELHFAIMGDDRLVSWGYNPALLVRPPYPRYEALRCCEEL